MWCLHRTLHKVLEIIQLVMMAVRKATVDNSPYVRKAAAQCMTKVYRVDPDQFMELRDMLLKMMGDQDVSVVIVPGVLLQHALPCSSQSRYRHSASHRYR